jgi:hypothetical protein
MKNIIFNNCVTTYFANNIIFFKKAKGKFVIKVNLLNDYFKKRIN